MSIQKLNPRTIHLGGEITLVNDISASEAITPGMLIERTAGQYRKHATAGGAGQPVFALEQGEMNLGIDDAYAADDLVVAGIGRPGTTFYCIIPSGENISDGEGLESAGNGKLRQLASGVQLVKAVEAVNNSAGPGDARLRVEVV